MEIAEPLQSLDDRRQNELELLPLLEQVEQLGNLQQQPSRVHLSLAPIMDLVLAIGLGDEVAFLGDALQFRLETDEPRFDFVDVRAAFQRVAARC